MNGNHILKQMTLNEFLGEFEFEAYLLYDRKHFHLIDLQGANLGDIESNIFTLDDENEIYNWKWKLIDRLDTYLNDYIINPIDCILEEDYGIESTGILEDMVDELQKRNLPIPDEDIVNVILNPDLLELGELIMENENDSNELIEHYNQREGEELE